MNRKMIASIVLLMSASSAHALVVSLPGSGSGSGSGVGSGSEIRQRPPKQRTYCLSMYELRDGSIQLGSCDHSMQNRMWGAKINENGCADDQAALVSVKVEIKACPTFVQL